ncbi:MAG: (E)-4-hydroxy-3-methylbut-2-enyl-diphosphate synthase [Marinilabilia sp.]
MEESLKFCHSYFRYSRNCTTGVKVGKISIGGDAPVRIQSMTTTNTLDTEDTTNQALKIAGVGGELVRITTQGRREAANLQNIKQSLLEKGCTVPLAADVHFNPGAAEVAAALVEKVRINPGNFTGGAKKFRHVEPESEEDKQGLLQIREKFVPFLEHCKKHGTAIRIGTNHGSLSDRMMSLYGDTPEGMVESCMEYLRICREQNFEDVVLSIKSSNTRVMVHTVRLLVVRMAAEEMYFPLHLGVTEAGSGEDGRLKSAVGIGALLADGIGDTIRVSLTEPPEDEIPVARKLVEHFEKREGHPPLHEVSCEHYSPLKYHKRKTHEVLQAGGENPAVVMADVRDVDSFEMVDEIPEFIMCTYDQLGTIPPAWRKSMAVIDHSEIPGGNDTNGGILPLFRSQEDWTSVTGPVMLQINLPDLTGEVLSGLKAKSDVILLLISGHVNCTAEQRAFFMQLQNHGLTHPVIVSGRYDDASLEDFQLEAAADTGLLFLDGYGDGLLLHGTKLAPAHCVATSFGILQASRVRFSKTEYISCPGCGRTLFDLQKTTEQVRLRTAHLKGLKIAVMGCIVNGIGEMADADYGYVGAGPGRVSLFRNREVVRKNVPEEDAVEELVNVIKKFGDWRDSV